MTKFDLNSLPQDWPSELSFLPFIGDDYEKGVDGLRVLVLAESHYNSEKTRELTWEDQRMHTRDTFKDCAAELNTSRAWGNFYRRLDRVLARDAAPSDSAATKAWRHVAFSNYVQEFVGDAARQRPTSDHWKQAKELLPLLLELLHPDVVLVAGKQAWDKTPSFERPIGRIAASPDRDIWKLPYRGGCAMMSWIYHPSWPQGREPVDESIRIFKSLLQFARTSGVLGSEAPIEAVR